MDNKLEEALAIFRQARASDKGATDVPEEEADAPEQTIDTPVENADTSQTPPAVVNKTRTQVSEATRLENIRKERLENIRKAAEKMRKNASKAENVDVASAPAQARVGQTRTAVKNADKLETCFKVIDEDAEGLDLKNDLYIIMMINKLLLVSTQPDDKVVSTMGFDRGNLMKVMQAVFSLAQDKFVSKKKIRSCLLDKKPFGAIVYSDILGLDASSTKEKMQQRLKAFASQIEPLDELFDYDSASHVMQTLVECDKAQDVSTKLAIVKKHGFASETRFHEGDIDQIIEDLKSKRKGSSGA